MAKELKQKQAVIYIMRPTIRAKRKPPIKKQFQNAAMELKLTQPAAQQAVRDIERIRRGMRKKTFKNFEAFLTEFQYSVFREQRKKGRPIAEAEHKARGLADIIRQARWMNMRTKIAADAKKNKK
jgi:hypothetical protein